MNRYETIEVWNRVQKIILARIEKLIQDGCDLCKDDKKCEELADSTNKEIVRTLVKEFNISEYEIPRLMDKFYPIIIDWINSLKLKNCERYKEEGRLNELSISITNDLVRSFLEEEDYVELS